jgi:hypothetical protein
VGWPLSGGSGRLAVLADESAAGGVSSDRSALPILDDAAIVGCASVEAAVGPVGVVVLEVVAQELFELSAVPDEGAVEELAAHGADPSFRVCVGDRGPRWRADDRRAAASEDLVERRDELAGAVADQEPDLPVGAIMKFRAAWVVQAPVGLVVMPARYTRRVSSSMKNKR